MAVSPYKEALDNTTWSYSRIHSYTTCPAMFRYVYLEKKPKVENAFAEFGSFCHSILESYEKGELAEYELGDVYQEKYDENVTCDFPVTKWGSMGEKYYSKGLSYFETFEGFPENWELIGAEIDAEFCISNYNIVGFIDLLVRDKNDGKLIVVDHKSKAKFKNKDEQEEYAIQLYLYSKWVYENYGEYPKELVFNMFREQEMVVIPFNLEDYKKAIQWVIDTIQNIYNDFDFWDKIKLSCEKKGVNIPYKNFDFFCNNLCSCRTSCNRTEYGDEHE